MIECFFGRYFLLCSRHYGALIITVTDTNFWWLKKNKPYNRINIDFGNFEDHRQQLRHRFVFREIFDTDISKHE